VRAVTIIIELEGNFNVLLDLDQTYPSTDRVGCASRIALTMPMNVTYQSCFR
jgi:hypothetical protein